jgi:hypothetical protein
MAGETPPGGSGLESKCGFGNGRPINLGEGDKDTKITVPMLFLQMKNSA